MKRLSISVPDEVAAALIVQAEAEHRSVSSLVAHRLATDARTGLPHLRSVPNLLGPSEVTRGLDGSRPVTGSGGKRTVAPIPKGPKR